MLGVDFNMAAVERRPQRPAPSRAEPQLLERLAAAGIQISLDDDCRIFHGHGHSLGTTLIGYNETDTHIFKKKCRFTIYIFFKSGKII